MEKFVFINCLILREKGYVYIWYLEESCVIMFVVRDKGCDFVVFGINDLKFF